MSFRFRRHRSVGQNVRVVAEEQLEKAIGEIRDKWLDRHETVHQVRKRCKKIRGLIRLVRPAFADYRKENRFFRDTASRLSFARDSQSVIECFDKLMTQFQGDINPRSFSAIRMELIERRQRIADDTVGIDREIGDVLASMQKAQSRIGDWRIDGGNFESVRGGLMKSYRRGRKAFRTACRKPVAENFHEWRKRTKYHWYHTRLLQCIWPAMMKLWSKSAGYLADLLGDEHDLAVLRDLLMQEDDPPGRSADVRLFVRLIDKRRQSLQLEARALGEKLYCERPEDLAARYGAYWNASAMSSV